jgi:hypothetical protein
MYPTGALRIAVWSTGQEIARIDLDQEPEEGDQVQPLSAA